MHMAATQTSPTLAGLCDTVGVLLPYSLGPNRERGGTNSGGASQTTEGDSGPTQALDVGVRCSVPFQYQACHGAFSAILGDGSVVTWGSAAYGGDSSAARDQLKNMQQIQALS